MERFGREGVRRMGVCLTVQADLKFGQNGPDAFCSAVRSAVQRHCPALLSRKNPDLRGPLGCFSLACGTDTARMENGLYTAEFEAAYGLELILRRIFLEAAKALADGSEVFISPDDFWYTMSVKDGRVVYRDCMEEQNETRI